MPIDKTTFRSNPNTGQVEEYDDLQINKATESTSFYWSMSYPRRAMLSPPKTEDGGELDAATAGKWMKTVGGYGPSPALIPITQANAGGTNHLSKATMKPSVFVNVRDNHHWTESPISSRREVPMLNIKEMKILTNTALNQMLNMGFAATASAGGAVENVSKLIGTLKESSYEKAIKEIGITASSVSDLGSEKSYYDPMNPYSLLYTTTPTNFRYTFPYMQDTYLANSGGFGDTGGGTMIMDAMKDWATGFNETFAAANLSKSFAPGRMVEEPKGFNFTGREKSYTVTFPLFNTKSYGEVVRNWQFLYLLSYQNTPNRVSRDLIDPPCIYEAYIPGVWYSKYSSLTNMTVDFIGARREMYIPIKTIDYADGGQNRQTATGEWTPRQKKTLAVIPDAYNVTLTFTELFSETQNFKFQMLRESMNDIITTGTMK
jgi:hypothetical protein